MNIGHRFENIIAGAIYLNLCQQDLDEVFLGRMLFFGVFFQTAMHTHSGQVHVYADAGLIHSTVHGQDCNNVLIQDEYCFIQSN